MILEKEFKNILPFERSYWVIPGKILVGEYPSSVNEEERLRKLNGLVDVGIKTVINLTEVGEKNNYGIELHDYSLQFRSAGIELHRRPIKDVTIPTNEEMDGILYLIEDSLARNKPVYFHCWGGVGRAGTVLGCYLLKSKMATIFNVFDYINYLKRTTSLNNRLSPETIEQMDFVKDYSNYFENKNIQTPVEKNFSDCLSRVKEIKSALFGVAVGDALGVPVEFKSRQTIRKNPVTDMIGYGTYNLPAGTWSDDSSLSFCLAEALTQKFDLNVIGQNFIKWYHENYWTPYGYVFDIGIASRQAISRLAKGEKPDFTGGFDESDNGNGSLMRILPLLFILLDQPINDRYNITKKVSSITHGHIRSVIACFYYLEFAKQLFEGKDKFEIYKTLQTDVLNHLTNLSINQKEINLFERLLKKDIHELPEVEIQSSGYVLHTLEASIWCLLTTENYKEAVLKAVNLGDDTDTTGAVTGGLAGLLYGIDNIPEKWLKQLARYDDIENLAKRLADKIARH